MNLSTTKPKRTLPLVALVISLPVLAACGESGASSGGPSPATAAGKDNDQYVKFAQCMRRNGVPQWPDPVDGDKFRMRATAGPGSVDPNSPQFKAASQKCASLAPPGWGPRKDPANQAQMLKFSQCMRKNGVPKFPDPQGGALPSFDKSVNPDSPEFKNAQKACQNLAPGGVGG